MAVAADFHWIRKSLEIEKSWTFHVHTACNTHTDVLWSFHCIICWGFGYLVQAPCGEVHVFPCGSAGFHIYTVLYVLIPHMFAPIHSFCGSATNVNFSPRTRQPREFQHYIWSLLPGRGQAHEGPLNIGDEPRWKSEQILRKFGPYAWCNPNISGQKVAKCLMAHPNRIQPHMMRPDGHLNRIW